MKPYGILGKDFFDKSAIQGSGEDNVCELCEAHDQAKKKIVEIACPNCQKDLTDAMTRCLINSDYEKLIVGEDNGLDVEHQRFALLPVIHCDHCHQRIALWPEPVIYNGNHDVYYHGRQFSAFDNETLGNRLRGSRIEFLVKNWIERIQKREQLDASHLTMWVQGEAEQVLNLYLIEMGYKRGTIDPTPPASTDVGDMVDCFRLMNQLREGEGWGIMINCSNPDGGDDQPNEVVEWVSEHTQWKPKRFGGNTLKQALEAAITFLKENRHEPRH